MNEPRNNNNVEQFSYGIERWWLDDGAIAVVKTQGDMTHDAIDAWADLLIAMLHQWANGSRRPIAFLHDLTHPNQGLTPYSRKRVNDVLAAIPDAETTFTAIVLPNTFINRIISMFVRSSPFRQNNHQTRVFTDLDTARDWLREGIINLQCKY